MKENLYKQAFDAYDMDKNCGFLMEECGLEWAKYE